MNTHHSLRDYEGYRKSNSTERSPNPMIRTGLQSSGRVRPTTTAFAESLTRLCPSCNLFRAPREWGKRKVCIPCWSKGRR